MALLVMVYSADMQFSIDWQTLRAKFLLGYSPLRIILSKYLAQIVELLFTALVCFALSGMVILCAIVMMVWLIIDVFVISIFLARPRRWVAGG